jgi:hypothetical protein
LSTMKWLSSVDGTAAAGNTWSEKNKARSDRCKSYASTLSLHMHPLRSTFVLRLSALKSNFSCRFLLACTIKFSETRPTLIVLKHSDWHTFYALHTENALQLTQTAGSKVFCRPIRILGLLPQAKHKFLAPSPTKPASDTNYPDRGVSLFSSVLHRS